jgi:hypothetical protein
MAVASEMEEATSQQVEESKEGKRFSLGYFSFRAGFYYISANTRIRLDALGGLVGTTIDLEDDLDLDEDKSTYYLSFAWRMTGRHFLEFEYFNLNRNGAATLTAEIEFGDEIFNVGAEVKSFFDTDVTRVSYAFLLKDTDNYAFAISAGLHITDLNTGITEINSQFAEDTVAVAAVTAPLPVIGVTGAWRINEKWLMYGRLQIFRLTFDDFSGRLDHASAKLEYSMFEHVGIGVGYDLFAMGVDVDRKLWNGDVTFSFKGPILYLKGQF